MKFKTLEIHTDDERIAGDGRTIMVRRLPGVDVIFCGANRDGHHAIATVDGVVVARLSIFDDDPILIEQDCIRISGILSEEDREAGTKLAPEADNYFGEWILRVE